MPRRDGEGDELGRAGHLLLAFGIGRLVNTVCDAGSSRAASRGTVATGWATLIAVGCGPGEIRSGSSGAATPLQDGGVGRDEVIRSPCASSSTKERYSPVVHAAAVEADDLKVAGRTPSSSCTSSSSALEEDVSLALAADAGEHEIGGLTQGAYRVAAVKLHQHGQRLQV